MYTTNLEVSWKLLTQLKHKLESIIIENDVSFYNDIIPLMLQIGERNFIELGIYKEPDNSAIKFNELCELFKETHISGEVVYYELLFNMYLQVCRLFEVSSLDICTLKMIEYRMLRESTGVTNEETP